MRAEHFNAKLTWPEVREIRSLAKQGYAKAYLGRLYHVTEANIRDIVAGRTWKEEK